jgi:ABC-type transport system substrate-binding protein
MEFWTCGSDYFADDVGYCNPEYDALVERADQEMGPVALLELVAASQRLLLSGAPAILGYNWDMIFLVKSRVTGYSLPAPYQAWPGWWTPLTVDIALPR